MKASWMSLIAILLVMSCATRVKLIPRPGVIPGSATGMHQGPMMQTPVNTVHPRMQEHVGEEWEWVPDGWQRGPDGGSMMGHEGGGWHPGLDFDGGWAPDGIGPSKEQWHANFYNQQLAWEEAGIDAPLGSDPMFPEEMFPEYVPLNIAGGMAGGTQGGMPDPGIAEDKLPLTSIHRMDPRPLLNDWVEASKSPEFWVSSPEYQYDKTAVLQNMWAAVADAPQNGMHPESDLMQLTAGMVTSRQVEMVGLVSKPFRKPIEASVTALGVFSQGKIFDDDKGTLLEHLREEYKKQGDEPWWDRDALLFPVLAIRGLADAPGLDEKSSKVLLSKIEEYARKEKCIVVVPEFAYILADGTDLEKYYVRLGFVQVKMENARKKGPLVYVGPSASADDESVDNQQTMVHINLWPGE